MTLGNYGTSFNRLYTNNNDLHLPKIFRKSSSVSKKSSYIETGPEDNVIFTDAKYEGNVLNFKKPIVMRLSKDKYGMYLDNDYLDIHCSGENKNELYEDFYETAITLKEEYLDCDVNELSSSGIILRNKLKEYYDSIQR